MLKDRTVCELNLFVFAKQKERCDFYYLAWRYSIKPFSEHKEGSRSKKLELQVNIGKDSHFIFSITILTCVLSSFGV